MKQSSEDNSHGLTPPPAPEQAGAPAVSEADAVPAPPAPQQAPAQVAPADHFAGVPTPPAPQQMPAQVAPADQFAGVPTPQVQGSLSFTPMSTTSKRRVVYTTNAIESLNYQLRKITKNRGHFPSEEAAVKLLWLAICNIEDKRAAQRLTDAGKPPNKRTGHTRLIQGHTTTNWKQALAQLTTAYPDRITPYL